MPREHQRAHQNTDIAGRSLPGRLLDIWGALDRDRQLAAGAAAAMFITMLLPWYSKSYTVVVKGSAKIASTSLSAFQDFSFVEAAVLLVSAGVLSILFARAERRHFQLPGGDGFIIMIAGAWCALLIFYRLLSKPGTAATQKISTTIGIQWGIFFALAAAGLLAYAGSRMRGVARTESPPAPRRTRTHRPPRDEDVTVAMPPPPPPSTEPETAAGRSRYPPSPAKRGKAPRAALNDPERTEQLSFDDQPTEGAGEQDS
jgi:type IV secretory pathway TrbD component